MNWVKQAQPRRFQRGAELAFAALAPAPVVELVEAHRGGGDRLAVGVELGREDTQEPRPAFFGEREIGPAQHGGAGAGGDFPAAAFEAGAHLPAHPVGVALGKVGGERRPVVAGGDVAPLAEDALEGPLQQAIAHGPTAPSSRSFDAARNRYPSLPGAATSWTPDGNRPSPGTGTDIAGQPINENGAV